jgi:hypothetical protein
VTSCGDRFVYRWDVPSGTMIESYGTRRLFDHLIEPAPSRSVVSEAGWGDRYLQGEAVYDVVLVRTSHRGSFAALSAVRRDGDNEEQRMPTCVAVVNLAAAEVWSVEFAQSEPISAFAVTDEGAQLVCARSDHTIEIWMRDSDAPASVLRGHAERVNGVALVHGGCAQSQAAGPHG